MRNTNTTHLSGSVLPTVIVVSVLILTAMMGLLMLHEQETVLFAQNNRIRQSRANVESAYALYRMYPQSSKLRSPSGFLLYDSIPTSRVHIQINPWGLYETVQVITSDSLHHACRIFGTEPDSNTTLWYAQKYPSVELTGRSVLRGILHLPVNGISYGRIGSVFFCGEEISPTAIQSSDGVMPHFIPIALNRIEHLFSVASTVNLTSIPDSLHNSFRHNPTTILRMECGELRNCNLSGNIILYADELRIDSTCRIENLIVCARKVTVGQGARITAQIFTRDTLFVESRAKLKYPSGLYSQRYLEVREKVTIDGYVIIRDTSLHEHLTASYQQARTARTRGLIWIDGTAHIQGIVAGQLMLRQAAYFLPHGYVKNMFCDITLLENPHTAHPLWLTESKIRKEIICVD